MSKTSKEKSRAPLRANLLCPLCGEETKGFLPKHLRLKHKIKDAAERNSINRKARDTGYGNPMTGECTKKVERSKMMHILNQHRVDGQITIKGVESLLSHVGILIEEAKVDKVVDNVIDVEPDINHQLIDSFSGEKLNKCDQCNYSCSRSGDLSKLKRSHTGEKPYKCDRRSLSLTHNSHLSKLKRMHTKEKPHNCDHCSYSCANKNNLVQHKRMHNSKSPFKENNSNAALSRKTNKFQRRKLNIDENQCEMGNVINRACESNAQTLTTPFNFKDLSRNGIRPCLVKVTRLSVRQIHSLCTKLNLNSNIKVESETDAFKHSENNRKMQSGAKRFKVEVDSIIEEPIDAVDQVFVESIVKQEYLEVKLLSN